VHGATVVKQGLAREARFAAQCAGVDRHVLGMLGLDVSIAIVHATKRFVAVRTWKTRVFLQAMGCQGEGRVEHHMARRACVLVARVLLQSQ
jgi:hypothetical protein